MSTGEEEATLVFDFHFKLVTPADGVLRFLRQFENAEIQHSEFEGKVKFEYSLELIKQNKNLQGKEEAFQKELNGMFGEIKLEICRRLKVLFFFQKTSSLIKEDWQKLKVFNSILIDLKQQGLFEMVNQLLREHNVNLGKRWAYEEKYKTFTPNLNGKNKQNHIQAELKSRHENVDEVYYLWLNSLESEKAFRRIKDNYQEINALKLPEDIIYEKVIPKIIDRNSLIFNVNGDDLTKFEDKFRLENYFLTRQ